MGGSYNPVHRGHMTVADHVRRSAGMESVWMVVSPQNPLKRERAAASAADRLAMVALAAKPYGPAIEASAVEIEQMEPPYYTIDTLDRLSAMHPDRRFRLVIGSDNWLTFDRWHRAADIIARYGVTVYPRPGYPVDAASLPPGVNMADAPVVEISSTLIREAIAAGADVSDMLPDGVADYIESKNLYR